MQSDEQNIVLTIDASDRIVLDWSAVEALCQRLVDQIEESMVSFDNVLALGRGAAVPGAILSHMLDAQLLYEGVNSYKGNEPGEGMNTYQACKNPLNTASTLVVDDLWDSGQTFRYAKALWPLAKTGALLTKCRSDETILDYVGLDFPTDAWIVFPWEK